MIFAAASSRSSRFRILLALLVAVLTAGMMALWMSVPAHADPTQVSFQIKLVNKSGGVLGNYDVYPIEVQGGTAVAFQNPDPATPHLAKPGYYDLTLTAGAEYTLFFVPNGTSANSGTIQYLGGTPTIDHATTFTPSTDNSFLTASIATGGTISGKVTSPSGGALKNAEVAKFEYDGTNWVSNDYTLTSSTGAYTFTNVDPGSYKFEFYAPTGQYPPIYSGSAKTLDSATPTFVAAGATATVNQKFAAGTGAISGTAYLDTTDDDQEYYDSELVPTAFPVTSAVGSTTTIDTDKGVYGAPATGKGKWTVKNLPAGRYIVQLQPGFGGEYVEYLTGEDGSDSADLADAKVYTVAAGKTTSTGTTEFTGRDNTLGAEPNITVKDSVSHSFIGGALIDVSPTTAPTEDIYGTSTSGGAPTQLYFDASDPVALSENSITQDGPFPLSPGWYDITVVDPTGNHEPQKLHRFLDFGASAIAFSLVATTTTPAVEPGTIDNGDDTQVGTQYAVQNAAAARDDATLSYQWLRDDSPIYGATTEGYTSTGGDLGKQLSVRVTASSFGYADVSQVLYVGGAAGNPETEGGQITNETAPSLVQTTDPRVGDSVSANVGGWQIDGNDSSGLSFTYQWVLNKDFTPIDIAGGTNPTYVVTSGEIGDTIGVYVTAHKTGFADSDPVYSNSLNVESQPAPVNTKSPKVTTTTKSGVTTYTVSTGTWNQSGLTYAYSWGVGDIGVGTPRQTENSINSAEIFLAAGPPPYADPIVVEVLASQGGNDAGTASVVVKLGTDVPSQTSAPVVTDETESSTVSGADAVALGDTLRVISPGVWAASGGTTGGSTSYQWYRNGVVVKGATSATYKVTTADTSVDGTTELSLTETFASEFYSAKVTSEPTQIAQVVNPGFPSEPTASLSGAVVIGQPVKVTATGWGVSGVTLSYKWFGCESPCSDSDDTGEYVPIPGATKSSLTLTSNDEYDDIYGEVIGFKAGYGTETVDTEPEEVFETGFYYPITGPSFTGTAAVGQKLKAVTPKWSASGIANHYSWESQTCDPSSCDSNAWTPIPGATLSTYTPTAADYGSGGVSIRLEDLATKGSGDGDQWFSSAQALGLGTLAVKTAPKITVSGGQYTVANGTYSVSGGEHQVIIYKDGDGLDGNTRATDPSDIGKAIYATDTYTATGYNPLTQTVVYRKGATTSASETVSGSLLVGRTLTPSVLLPFDNALHSDYAVTYQWYSNGKAVAGAAGKGATFVVASSYYGKKLTVKVTGTTALYATASVTSASATIARGDFGDPDSPAIQSTGTLEAGVKATVALGDYGTTGVAFKYVWQRSSDEGLHWTNIAGATKSAYTPVATDGGDELQVVVTASKTNYTSQTLDSDPVLIDYPATLAPLAPPTLTGTGEVGGLLTVHAGTWNVLGLSYVYSWYRNGVLIPGVTGTTWTPTATSSGDEITVTVRASKVGYATVPIVSSAVTVTDADAPVDTTTPSASANPNNVLNWSVTTGSWNVDGLTYAYQWYFAGSPIDGATGESITLDQETASAGGDLTVTVTASRDGYTTAVVNVFAGTFSREVG